MGPASSTLLVEESIFDANAVRVPMDGAGMDVTVRINTARPYTFSISVHALLA